jgi:hypothetical protein
MSVGITHNLKSVTHKVLEVLDRHQIGPWNVSDKLS